MDLNLQKEQFSNTYIQAVTTVAGYSLYRPDIDDDSVDLGIAAKNVTGIIVSPRLELQLKCTSRDLVDSNYIRYPLKLKNYHELRVNTLVPRILVVVVVPDNVNEWLQQSESQLCMRHCGYWLSLRGMPDTENLSTVTVRIARSSQFTVAALQSIIAKISQGGRDHENKFFGDG